MQSVGKKVIGQLGQLGKKVGKQVAKTPVDIAETAFESLSGKRDKTPSKRAPQAPMHEVLPPVKKIENGPWADIDSMDDKKAKAAFARNALKQFAGISKGEKEPSVYEKIQKEQAEKKEQLELRKKQARSSVLPDIKGKQKRGSAFSHKKMRKKQTGMETKVNIKAG